MNKNSLIVVFLSFSFNYVYSIIFIWFDCILTYFYPLFIFILSSYNYRIRVFEEECSNTHRRIARLQFSATIHDWRTFFYPTIQMNMSISSRVREKIDETSCGVISRSIAGSRLSLETWGDEKRRSSLFAKDHDSTIYGRPVNPGSRFDFQTEKLQFGSQDILN